MARSALSRIYEILSHDVNLECSSSHRRLYSISQGFGSLRNRRLVKGITIFLVKNTTVLLHLHLSLILQNNAIF